MHRHLTRWALPACVLAALLFASTVSAKPRTDRSLQAATASELHAQVAHAKYVIQFFTRGRGHWMLASRHATCDDVEGAPQALCVHARARLRIHRWILASTQRRLAALLPRPVGHLAFWTCVHNGEGAWNASTGNGYFGGLQMTFGWDGLVGNAALLSPHDQIAAAEEGFRRSGYSTAWLQHQWPNTSPPCLGLLG